MRQPTIAKPIMAKAPAPSEEVPVNPYQINQSTNIPAIKTIS